MRPETVNVIIIGYAQPKLERTCLKAVHANTAHPYLLTYYDNYASGWSLTQAWNALIDCTPCDTVCLLNNDTEVQPDWLTLLYDSLGKHYEDDQGIKRKIGFVGPSTNQCHSVQKTIPTFEAAKKHQGEVDITPQPISGFCLLFERHTWIALNGFDERYTLYGQESDFIYRAVKQLGLYCAWRKDAFVFHHGEASVKAAKIDVEAERKKAKDIYWKERK
jgi:GT2 family glycosyltransferase